MVAFTPRCCKSGWAQWWPARTGDAGIGQNGGDIVGMHIVYGKGKDAVVLLRGVRAQKMDVGDLFYALQHEGGEILFPLPDAVEADLRNIVNGGFQPYGPARRSRSRPRTYGGPRRTPHPRG